MHSIDGMILLLRNHNGKLGNASGNKNPRGMEDGAVKSIYMQENE